MNSDTHGYTWLGDVHEYDGVGAGQQCGKEGGRGGGGIRAYTWTAGRTISVPGTLPTSGMSSHLLDLPASSSIRAGDSL